MSGWAKKVDAVLEFGGTKKDIAFLLISGLSLLVSMFASHCLPFDAAWIAIVLCGVPIVVEAALGLITRFDIKADVLVAMALIASVSIGEYFAAGEVAFIMLLGEKLEIWTLNRARAGIEKLVHLTPRTARVLTAEGERIVPAEEVKVGDCLRVLPGETVPVDGVIVKGTTSINQAVMTGESLPVDKSIGDAVSSGTVNQCGSFDMEAVRVGEDSSIQRMIRLVQSADAGKAKIVGLADRWATWIVVGALVSSVLTWVISGEAIRAVTILVVFCPCALVLATPTAIVAAIGNATKHGFLVREGDALERLARISKITLDKTGTLTYGTPKVIGVKAASGFTEADIYAYAAAAEAHSEHPLGKAVVRCFQQTQAQVIPEAEDFAMTPGKGVTATVRGHKITAGNKSCLNAADGAELPAAKDYLEQGATVIYLTVDEKLAGCLALADTPRAESADMIKELQQLDVEPVLLTGDHELAARAMGKLLGIKELHAECLPEDKLNHIDAYQKQGAEVCMIGDGINDAPALKKANVGIAMGGVGSDITVEAADIALVDDEIKELPHLVKLSRRMMTTIKINMTFSMILNFTAIVLAMTGILGPVIGALVHNAGSVLVIGNSALLLRLKTRR